MSSKPLGKGDFVRLRPSILGDAEGAHWPPLANTANVASRIPIVISREQFGLVTRVVEGFADAFYIVLWISPNYQPAECVMGNDDIEKVSSQEVPAEYMKVLASESL